MNSLYIRELEQDRFIIRKQFSTIPSTVEFSLAERGRTLIPALESVYKWAKEQIPKEIPHNARGP